MEEGGRGTGYAFALLDRENWAQVDFPILSLVEQEFGEWDIENEPVTAHMMELRIGAIEKITARVGLRPVRMIDMREQDSEDKPAKDSFEISFDGLTFNLTTEGTVNRSYLHLTCKQFLPTRSIRILAVNNHPNYISEEDLEDTSLSLTQVKRYERIHKVFISEQGKYISILIGSNPENLCLGTVDYTFIHLTLDELRKTCIDCISR